MLLSIASMNLGAFTVLKAFAMLLTTSTISSWVSDRHGKPTQTRMISNFVGQVDNLPPIENRPLSCVDEAGSKAGCRQDCLPHLLQLWAVLRTIACIDLNVLFR